MTAQTSKNVTLLLGPPTRAALVLNALVREHRVPLGAAGLAAVPSRLATPALRAAADIDVPREDRREAFVSAYSGVSHVLLSSISFFGPPKRGLSGKEILTDLEPMLLGLVPILEREAWSVRVVLTIDYLPHFILAYGSEGLNARTAATPWDVLYELSWADLVTEVVSILPFADVAVLTPLGAATRSPELVASLFKPAGDVLPDRFALLSADINTTGQAVLAPLVSDHKSPERDVLVDLYGSFKNGPTDDDVRKLLGIDTLTGTLLKQRFDEDLERIAELPVQLF